MNESGGIAFLTERLAKAERDRDELQNKADRLQELQQSFVQITKARSEHDVASEALQGAWGLGFARAIWFAVDERDSVTALLEFDGAGIVASEYGGDFPPQSSLRRIVRGGSIGAIGSEGDDDAALYDTRRHYAASAVFVGDRLAAIVYADGIASRGESNWLVWSLSELAAHAELVLDNLRMAAELERLAMHDPLTGLLNRRALMDRLAREFATARRTGEGLAFAMIDVDDFKHVNDSRGHAGGDQALKAIAGILSTATREIDIAARFAGDEFSLIMPRTDRAAADAVMMRIRERLHAEGLACSIGIAFRPEESDDLEALMAAADHAVYEAKAAGKDCHRFAATGGL